MRVFTGQSDPAEVERALAAGDPLWLDAPEERLDLDGPLARAVGLDKGRLERLRQRGERPGLIVEDDRGAVMYAGAVRTPEGGVAPVDTLLFVAPGVLVTLRDTTCQPLDELRAAVAAGSRTVDAVLVLNVLTGTLLSVTEEIQDEVDGIENRVLDGNTEDVLRRIRLLRQGLATVLRVARSQRVLVATATDELAELPGLEGTPQRRARDLGVHLALAADLAESTRQSIGEALDLSLSLTSNRLGAAAERLSVIATVVLPATVVSGFFGMNFMWMTDRLDSFWSFLVLGVGGVGVSILATRLYLRSRRLD